MPGRCGVDALDMGETLVLREPGNRKRSGISTAVAFDKWEALTTLRSGRSTTRSNVFSGGGESLTLNASTKRVAAPLVTMDEAPTRRERRAEGGSDV